MVRGGAASTVLLLFFFVGAASGSLGVLGRVENEEGELRHTVGVVGRADEQYQKAEGVRTQAKEIERSALHMERVLEKRLASLMAQEGRSAWIEPKKGSYPAMPSTAPHAVAHVQQKAQIYGDEKPASAAAARKAAVLSAKHNTAEAKRSHVMHARSKQAKPTSWVKQWLWPFA